MKLRRFSVLQFLLAVTLVGLVLGTDYAIRHHPPAWSFNQVVFFPDENVLLRFAGNNYEIWDLRSESPRMRVASSRALPTEQIVRNMIPLEGQRVILQTDSLVWGARNYLVDLSNPWAKSQEFPKNRIYAATQDGDAIVRGPSTSATSGLDIVVGPQSTVTGHVPISEMYARNPASTGVSSDGRRVYWTTQDGRICKSAQSGENMPFKLVSNSPMVSSDLMKLHTELPGGKGKSVYPYAEGSFHADSEQFASCNPARQAVIVQDVQGRELAALPCSTYASTAWSRDARRLLFRSLNEIEIWDLESKRQLLREEIKDNYPHNVSVSEKVFSSLSPDGRLLALSKGSTLRVVEVDTGAERVLTSGETRWFSWLLYSVAFIAWGLAWGWESRRQMLRQHQLPSESTMQAIKISLGQWRWKRNVLLGAILLGGGLGLLFWMSPSWVLSLIIATLFLPAGLKLVASAASLRSAALKSA